MITVKLKKDRRGTLSMCCILSFFCLFFLPSEQKSRIYDNEYGAGIMYKRADYGI